jgi:4-diphosphocytidyl-2-C-methyl-D-erythritol kinase
MICFPNAKINIGLNVLEKREDGYHNIESIFYPIPWCDALEVKQMDGKGHSHLVNFGTLVPGDTDSNLCTKVYNLLHAKYNLPSIQLWLLKHIPMGAGLGGGSSDAAFFLKLLNGLFKLQLGREELLSIASQIGSDCTFFLANKPSLISGKGDIITPIKLDLSSYYISIIFPQIHIDTKNAYSLITPQKSKHNLGELILKSPVQTWKEKVINDFEEPIFETNIQLAEIKKILYNKGALYASMTGSGSALYGIFGERPTLSDVLPSCKIFTVQPTKTT